MKALVTGASGFIGGAVARTLLDRGIDVRVLLRPGTRPNVADPRSVEVATGDLRDPDSLHRAAMGCGAIF
ncbi:MAG TPA: NAD-dependent epimerase/dehydratase family protein, partial [Kofleriaceae bacterium]|nr:NAD-dependent epimerase/dehydratase family protein [Kofleriaceae bacterium]